MPQQWGDTAAFGDSASGSPAVIVLDGHRTLGEMTFDSTGAGNSFAIAAGPQLPESTLTLDGLGTWVAVNVLAGSHEIAAPLVLGKNLVVDTTPSGVTPTSLTISGVIRGAGKSVTKAGIGTLKLLGGNTYTGPTTVSGGVLEYNLSDSPTVIDNQQLIINTGAVNASGTVDPFTDATDPDIHMDVLNDAALNITAGTKAIDTLTGTGTTTISATVSATQLTASYVRQGSVVLAGTAGNSARLIIRPSGSSLRLAPGSLGAAGSSPVSASQPVPEPGTLLLLSLAALYLYRYIGRARKSRTRLMAWGNFGVRASTVNRAVWSKRWPGCSKP